MIANASSALSQAAGEVSRSPVVIPAMSRVAGRAGHRFHAGMSFVIVALMMTSIVGGAWWFGPGRGGDDPMRLAALTQDDSTPEAYWPEPLNPVDDPWIAAITPEECTAEPISWEDFVAVRTTDPGPPQGSVEIVGRPEPADAEAAVTSIRGWTACLDLGYIDNARSYYTNEALFFKDVSIENQQYQDELLVDQEAARQIWSIWATDAEFMVPTLVEGVDSPPLALEWWEESEAYLATWDPGLATPNGANTIQSEDFRARVYSEVRWNPADAVLLADGRIMILNRYIYWSEDPIVEAFGVDYSGPNWGAMPIVLEEVDGEWKIDGASYWICIGGCGDYLSTPLPAAPSFLLATPVT